MRLKLRNLPFVGLFPLIIVFLGILSFSCADQPITTQNKASSELLLQITLRKEQLAAPTPERLAQMQAMGMNTYNLGIQRIYIYLNQQLTQQQQTELQTMGVQVYLNSWIPPVDNHPTGFYLADMPVDKLDALAAKEYVIQLDTAEKQLQPQSDMPKGG